MLCSTVHCTENIHMTICPQAIIAHPTYTIPLIHFGSYSKVLASNYKPNVIH